MSENNKKNRGGRPQLSTDEKNIFEVKTYLNKSEKKAFDLHLEKHKLKKSELVKIALLKHLKIREKKQAKLTPEILSFFYEIERTNHSLNQIAKMLNTGLQLNGRQTIEFFKTIAELKKNNQAIKNKLS